MGTDRRRVLATMPLHAITATYGEDGLRERFAMEVAPFPDADRQRLERALALAAGLHAADRRQREPYLNHLLRVATRIICHFQVRDPEVICAALLHGTTYGRRIYAITPGTQGFLSRGALTAGAGDGAFTITSTANETSTLQIQIEN